MIGWENGARFLNQLLNIVSKTKRKVTQTTFDTQVKPALSTRCDNIGFGLAYLFALLLLYFF